MKTLLLMQKIKGNWKSGLTVALVSIPLAVSLAIASGASPTLGIISAIWSGLIASIFGGSNFNVIGPTGALSGILATYAAIHGESIFPIIAILSGIIIVSFYFLNIEKYLIFLPSSSIQGFILGVAIIIIFNQINFAFNLTNLPQHEKFIANVIESIKHIPDGSLISFLIFLFFAAILLLLIKIIPKVPGVVIVSIIGIFLGYLTSENLIPLKLPTLESRFSNLHPKLFLPFTFKFSVTYIFPAIIVAVVSILETMISAKIADGMTKTKHNKKKEILGLGLANIVSGFAGGIPTTAALARTTLNIRSGATNKISCGISSFFIVIISFLLLNFFKFMPLVIIASILAIVGIRMIEMENFVKMYKTDKVNFLIGILVAGITILEDPMIGLLLGAIISMLIFMQKLSQGQYELLLNNQEEKIEEVKTNAKLTNTFIYSIKGELAYINSQSHITRFEKTPLDNQNIILDLKNINFIDHDGIEAIEEIISILETQQKNIYIVLEKNTLIEKMLKESNRFKKLQNNELTFETLSEALQNIKIKH